MYKILFRKMYIKKIKFYSICYIYMEKSIIVQENCGHLKKS